MIQLTKATKIRLLKCIKTGVFEAEQFPELQIELAKVSIELIDKSEDVNRKLSSEGKFLDKEGLHV
ncbi:MAG: hypothetical protein IPJ16_13100 [Bacteroidales bacterium]|nr:hypothetical protein [Bacteroidales bacterium]